MNATRLLPLGLLILTPLARAAQPLGIANGFNAFTFGNLSYGNNDTDGPLAAGGSMTVGGAFQVNSLDLGTTLGTPTMSNVGLLVGGSLAGPQNQGDLKIKGNAYVAGAISGGAIQYQNGALFTGSSVDTSVFTTQRAFSNVQSSAIRGLTPGGTITGSGNTFNLDLSQVPSIMVEGQIAKRISVAASTINANPMATLNLSGQDANTTLLIDVTGTGALTWNWTANLSARNKVLWNFNEITSLTIGQRDFSGSILAPGANVTVEGGNVNGNLVANNLTVLNGKELHMGSGLTFNGAAPVPEPASLAALAVGAAAILRRRKRA